MTPKCKFCSGIGKQRICRCHLIQVNTCAKCGNSFARTIKKGPDRKRHYCSVECSNAGIGRTMREQAAIRRGGMPPKKWRARYDRVCLVCAKLYSTGHKGRLTCSTDCARRLRSEIGKANRTKIVTCVVCQGKFVSRHAGREVCSRQCYSKLPHVIAGKKARKATRKRQCRKVNVLPDVIFNRDKWRCVYCNDKIRKYANWAAGHQQDEATLDHVIALAAGGDHVGSNLVAACRSCNSSKRDRNPLEFVQWLDARGMANGKLSIKLMRKGRLCSI